MMRTCFYLLTLAIALLSGGAHAQGGGGGGDTPTTSSEAAYCIQRGPDGTPVRKLSSEEVCPMYQFWREDCTRAGKTHEMGALGHCTPAAMGLRQEDLATGSIAPAR